MSSTKRTRLRSTSFTWIWRLTTISSASAFDRMFHTLQFWLMQIVCLVSQSEVCAVVLVMVQLTRGRAITALMWPWCLWLKLWANFSKVMNRAAVLRCYTFATVCLTPLRLHVDCINLITQPNLVDSAYCPVKTQVTPTSGDTGLRGSITRSISLFADSNRDRFFFA